MGDIKTQIKEIGRRRFIAVLTVDITESLYKTKPHQILFLNMKKEEKWVWFKIELN